MLVVGPPESFRPTELIPSRMKMGERLVKLGGSSPMVALVEFHPDVRDGDRRAIAMLEGLVVIENPDLSHRHLLVRGAAGHIRALAGWDEVAYVWEARDDLARAQHVYSCHGALSADGEVGRLLETVGDGWDGPGLGAARLLFSIEAASTRLDLRRLNTELARAFAEWSEPIQVDFVQAGTSTGRGHLNILFATGPHGDPFAFDGAGRTLAHAFYPSPPNPEPIAGDLHFDDSEPWHLGTSGIDLFSVALHELGHGLGLGHSDDPEAVMYPYYRQATRLSAADIRAVRRIYADRRDPPLTRFVPSETPVAAPTILNPAARSTVSSVISFQWSRTERAERYEFDLQNVSSSFRIKETLRSHATGTVYTIPSGEYRLDLRACAAVCNGATTRFTVAPVSPPRETPGRVRCAVTRDHDQNRLACHWNPIAGAQFYRAAVVSRGRGPGGGALTVAGQATDQTEATLLIPNGEFDVIVRGCTGDGCGPSSEPASVAGNYGDPIVPILASPLSGAVVQESGAAAAVHFSWSRVRGDTGGNVLYRLYIADFSRNATALDVITTQQYHSAHFSPGVRYDAVVVAITDGGREVRASSPTPFIVMGRHPRSPVVTEPPYGGTVNRDADGNVRLSWTQLVGNGGLPAGLYQYYVNTPTPTTGVTRNTSVHLQLPTGQWVAAVRGCLAGSRCLEGQELGWGPWNDQQGGEGGPGFFVVR